MPMPMWVTKVNKHVFNRYELRKGERPVLTHVGRRSGREFRTPLEVNRVDDTFIVALMYSSASDWVRNVLAAGSARLTIGGDELAIDNPRVITAAEARSLLPATFKPPPERLRVDEYLAADLAP